jgi:Plasmid pRiA4b ORF-3-like protein
MVPHLLVLRRRHFTLTFMTKAKPTSIYELRVDLVDTKPAIWRRFRIPSHATLADLHMVIQTVMGWTNSHLHEFRAGTKGYAQPFPDGDDFGTPAADEADVTVADVLTKPKQKIGYMYDFGDDWDQWLHFFRIPTYPLSESSFSEYASEALTDRRNTHATGGTCEE